MDHYSGTSSNNFNAEVMPRLTALRMLCDHPRLLTISANNFDDPDTQAGSKYAAALRGRLDGITTSAKMTATLDVITEILDENPRNKIVLFSFFKPMLAMISDKLKVDHELFTGDLSAKERDDAKERFTNDPRCRVLLSSDAGGIGVDLPVANYLISYDLPWSAGKYAQRQGRIIRISSEWPEVTLLSMIMSDSIEEWMLDVLEQKMAVANAWVDGTGVAQDGTLQLTASGLCDFLETH
jgi:SNF2 family DNA or RNA helicase